MEKDGKTGGGAEGDFLGFWIGKMWRVGPADRPSAAPWIYQAFIPASDS